MTTTIGDISRVLGFTAPLPIPQSPIEILLTDSRSLVWPGKSLFFAIPTAGNDGHRFVADLYNRGVRCFVVDHIPEEMQGVTDANIIVVPDVVEALQQVGAWRRDAFHGLTVAITGSRGKTTLKEWIFQILGHDTDMVRSPRSYNSQIGVPLSLWALKPDTTMAVIEAGISKTGEMSSLAHIIRPEIVILTNIGDQHSEGFADDPSKVSEKLLLASETDTHTLIYDADSPLIAGGVEHLPLHVSRIGISRHNPDATLYISKVESTLIGSEISWHYDGHSGVITIPFADDASVANAIDVLALLLACGRDVEQYKHRFASLYKIGTRLNVSEGVNNCSVIYDSYTSDFSSLLPALDFMNRREAPSQKSVLILSDLEHESGSDVADIPAIVAGARIDRFIGVGPRLLSAQSLFPKDSLFFASTDELLESLSTSDFDNEIILLKGAPEYGFGRILERLEARTHETVLEVNLDSIVANYNYFRRQLPHGTGLIAMVKASGYGAGSFEIAATMQQCGAAYVAVAVLDEGIELRNRGITMPIMVMNPKVVNYKSMFAHHLEPEIYSVEMLMDVIREAEKCGVENYPVHIKLDTGMHRMGFIESELPALMDILESQHAVTPRSVFSHLATADCLDQDEYTHLQLDTFERMTDYILSRSSRPVMRHILNSAGIIRFPEYHYDMARLGIGLYGVNTLPPEIEKPLAVVSTLRTVIIAIRDYNPGDTIGYGRWGRIERPSKIATIPIGYADGMNRHFGRGAISVLVNGKPAPTIGNICMDACMIDVTGIDCKVADSVEIFGPNNPVEHLAEVLDTIPYEILTSVSPRVKRVYYRE